MAKTYSIDDLIGTGVVINGATHRLLSVAQAPLLKTKEAIALFGRYGELVDKKDPSEAEATELKELPDRLCRMVLRASDDVHQTLDDDQRMALVSAFFLPPSNRPMESGA